MAGVARFIGGHSGTFAETLAQQDYMDELARGSELPNRGGIRVGQGSPVVSTAPPVAVGSPYPPNPNTLPAVRTAAGMPGPNSLARDFTLGAEGATVSPARPTGVPKAQLQLGYTPENLNQIETVQSRGARPAAPKINFVDSRTGSVISDATTRGRILNKGMGVLNKITASPVMKGLGIAGAAAQGVNAIQDFQQGDYAKGMLNTVGAVGGMAGPVGKALSAGIGVGSLIDAGLKAAKVGGYADEVYTPWQGTVATRPVSTALPEVDRAPMDMSAALAQAAKGAVQPADTTTPYDPTADDASRLAAREKQYAMTAQDAADTDARGAYAAGVLKQEAAARDAAAVKNRIEILNDIISNSGRPDSIAAAKTEMASLLGQQQVKLKADDTAARLEVENIKGGFGIKDQALRNKGGADVATITGAAHVKAAEITAKERADALKFTAEQKALYDPTKVEAAKIKSETDRANKITAAESTAYNEYIKLNPQDIEGAVAAAQGAGAVARGLVIKKSGTPAVKGKKHWYGDTPDVPAVPAQYGAPDEANTFDAVRRLKVKYGGDKEKARKAFEAGER